MKSFEKRLFGELSEGFCPQRGPRRDVVLVVERLIVGEIGLERGTRSVIQQLDVPS